MRYDKDPIVEEVRKVREEIMKESDYDPRAFGKILAEREKKNRKRRKRAKTGKHGSRPAALRMSA